MLLCLVLLQIFARRNRYLQLRTPCLPTVARFIADFAQLVRSAGLQGRSVAATLALHKQMAAVLSSRTDEHCVGDPSDATWSRALHQSSVHGCACENNALRKLAGTGTLALVRW